MDLAQAFRVRGTNRSRVEGSAGTDLGHQSRCQSVWACIIWRQSYIPPSGYKTVDLLGTRHREPFEVLAATLQSAWVCMIQYSMGVVKTADPQLSRCSVFKSVRTCRQRDSASLNRTVKTPKRCKWYPFVFHRQTPLLPYFLFISFLFFSLCFSRYDSHVLNVSLLGINKDFQMQHA